MTAETLVCEVAAQGKEEVHEEKLKIRELELQTQYELKYLTDSLIDLKSYVSNYIEQEQLKAVKLDKKITMISLLVIAQISGADIPALLTLFTKVGGM